MMSKDILCYRFPNQEIARENGLFKEVSLTQNKIDGFVITDFYKKKKFIFQSSQGFERKPFHLKKEIPYSITEQSYMDYASMVLRLMPTLGVEKIVLSRIKSTLFSTDKAWALFEKLCSTYPKAFVYMASSEYFGTWVGASPETLLETHADSGFTMSLAGTKEINSNTTWQKKEYAEQKFVTDYISNILNEQEVASIEINGPYTSPAGNVEHIRSDISFDLQKRKAADIANALHPTPAVCGVPKKESFDLIETVELKDQGYDRSLYCGYIGFVSEKMTKLYVNLRCCQLTENQAHIYVGGGYTSASTPEDEWEETERKSETLSRIFDLL